MNCAKCKKDIKDGRWLLQIYYQDWICSVCLVDNAMRVKGHKSGKAHWIHSRCPGSWKVVGDVPRSYTQQVTCPICKKSCSMQGLRIAPHKEVENPCP